MQKRTGSLRAKLEVAAFLDRGSLGTLGALSPRAEDEDDTGLASPKSPRNASVRSPRSALALTTPASAASPERPWAPMPLHGVLPLGSLSANTLKFFVGTDFEDFVREIAAEKLLAKQGFSKGGGYGVLQHDETGVGEAFDTLQGTFPRFKEFLMRVKHNVADALGVSPMDPTLRFVKVDSGGDGSFGGASAASAPSPVDGTHTTHTDVDALHNVRVCVSLFFVDEGVPRPPPYVLFAGQNKKDSLDPEKQYKSELLHGCIQGMGPATGFHGTGSLPQNLMRVLFVFDVDVSRHAIDGGEAIKWPVQTPFVQYTPVVVTAGTAAFLRLAVQNAPQSRESSKQGWLGWLKGKKYAKHVLREELKTITATEQRWLDKNRKGLSDGGASSSASDPSSCARSQRTLPRTLMCSLTPHALSLSLLQARPRRSTSASRSCTRS